MANSIVEELRRLRALSHQGGGEERIKKQKAAGKMTAHDRIELLLDKGSFRELDAFVMHRETNYGMWDRRIPGDSVVTGWGTIDGRLVYVFSQDFTVFGGSLGQVHAEKVVKIMDFGAFVEVLPGTDGLVHISQLDFKPVQKVTDILKVGDKVKVKVLEVNRDGKIRLSRKAALRAESDKE